MKTIEEASNEYSKSFEDNDYTIETESAFKAGVEFAQRWISVEDELPEVTKPYRDYMKVSDFVIAKLAVSDEWFKLRLIKGMAGNKEFTNWIDQNDYSYFTVNKWRPIEIK